MLKIPNGFLVPHHKIEPEVYGRICLNFTTKAWISMLEEEKKMYLQVQVALNQINSALQDFPSLQNAQTDEPAQNLYSNS